MEKKKKYSLKEAAEFSGHKQETLKPLLKDGAIFYADLKQFLKGHQITVKVKKKEKENFHFGPGPNDGEIDQESIETIEITEKCGASSKKKKEPKKKVKKAPKVIKISESYTKSKNKTLLTKIKGVFRKGL